MSESDKEVFFRNDVAHHEENIVEEQLDENNVEEAVDRQSVENGHEVQSNKAEKSKISVLESDIMSLLLNMSKPSRPRKDFPIYDGSESWDEYYQQVLRVKSLNGWSDQEAANFLSVSLKGPALETINAVQRAKRGIQLTWGELLENLQNTFAPVQDTYALRSMLRNRKQTHSETIPELHRLIRRDVSKAYPYASLSEQDNTGVEIFTEALIDPEIRLALFRAKPKTMTNALKIAEEERILLQGARRQHSLNINTSHTNSPHIPFAAVSSTQGYNTHYGNPTISPGPNNFSHQSRGRGLHRGGNRPQRSHSEEADDIRHQMAKLTARLNELDSATKPQINGQHKNVNGRGRGRGSNHRAARGKCWQCGDIGHRHYQCPLNC